jgi:hypothetical protein
MKREGLTVKIEVEDGYVDAVKKGFASGLLTASKHLQAHIEELKEAAEHCDPDAKTSCELCASSPTEDWTCHHHFGEHALIDYLGGNTFSISLFREGECVASLVVTEEECPLCGRDLMEVSK